MYRSKIFMLAIGLLCSAGFFLAEGMPVEASSLPPWPVIYSGSITIDGSPAPDGAQLTAKIGDTYTSVPVTVSGGRYIGMAVGGPDSSYLNKVITFHLDGVVTATETDIFLFYGQPELKSPFDLTFPSYPTPTPLPTATPTNTPIPTPTPDVPGAMGISGVVQIGEGDSSVLEGKDVVARVGSFFSQPVVLEMNYGILIFDGLILDPMDHKFIGEPLSFLVDGLSAEMSKAAHFTSRGSIDLVLTVALPEPTAVPIVTEAPVIPEPTSVPQASAATVVPPTAVPPTPPTAVPPTVVPPTVVPPTAVPPAAVAPTAAPAATAAPVVIVVTATPDTNVPLVEEDAGGSCNLPGKVSRATGAANALMLFSPLLFLAGYRGFKGRKEIR